MNINVVKLVSAGGNYRLCFRPRVVAHMLILPCNTASYVCFWIINIGTTVTVLDYKLKFLALYGIHQLTHNPIWLSSISSRYAVQYKQASQCIAS